MGVLIYLEVSFHFISFHSIVPLPGEVQGEGLAEGECVVVDVDGRGFYLFGGFLAFTSRLVGV